MQTSKPTNDPSAVTAATWAARKARAVAYLQERPPKGQAWTQKKQGYDYRDDAAPTGGQEEGRDEH